MSRQQQRRRGKKNQSPQHLTEEINLYDLLEKDVQVAIDAEIKRVLSEIDAVLLDIQDDAVTLSGKPNVQPIEWEKSRVKGVEQILKFMQVFDHAQV